MTVAAYQDDGGYFSPMSAEIMSPAHAIRWWTAEAIYNVRRARKAATESMRAWHLGQAVQAREYAREVRRCHPNADTSTCTCRMPQLMERGR